MLRFRRALVALSLLTLSPASAFAQTVKAGTVTTLEGQVTATRSVTPQPVPLKFRDDVFVQDKVVTGEQSLARMLLGGKAVVTVRERSSVTITEMPGRSTIDIDSGKIALAVAREKMQPGEVINLRTPNAVAGVRGTVVVADVACRPATTGACQPVSDLFVLRGGIDVVHVNPVTQAPISAPVAVNALERFNASGVAPATKGTISPQDVPGITAGLQPKGVQAAGAGSEVHVRADAARTAVALVGALTGAGPTALLTGSLAAPALAAPTATTNTTAAPITPLTQSTTMLDAVAPVPLPSAPVTPPGTAPTTPPPATSPPTSGPPPPPPPGPPQDPPSPPDTGRPPIVLSGQTVTLPVGRPLLTLTGASDETIASPLVQITGSTVRQQGPDNLIQVTSGSNVSLTSPLAVVTDSTLSPGSGLLNVPGAISSTSSSPLISLDPTTVTAPAHLISVSSSVNLAGPLLADVGGTLTANRHLLHVDRGLVASTTSGGLLQLTNTGVTAGANLVNLAGRSGGGEGQTLSLRGSLLRAVDARIASPRGGGGAIDPNIGGSLGMGDDTTTNVAFGFPFPFLGRTFTGAEVSSNGFISLGGLNGSDCCSADVGRFLTGAARIAAAWYDIDPRFGSVNYNTSGNRALLTWDAPEFPNRPPNGPRNKFQMQLSSDGRIRFVFDSLLPDGGVPGRPVFHDTIVGITPGGGVADPGEVNFSTNRSFSTTVGTVYEFFERGRTQGGDNFDLQGLNILFTPRPDSGWDVLVSPNGTGNGSSASTDSSIIALTDGAIANATGSEPLFDLTRTTVDWTGRFLTQTAGSAMTLEGMFLLATDSPLTLPTGLAHISGGSHLTITGAGLASIVGGTHAIATDAGSAMIDLLGTSTAADPATELTLGTERPLRIAGPALDTSGATVTGETAVRFDTMLFEATAPLLNLRANSSLTANANAIDLSLRAVVTSIGPVVRLDSSALTVNNGSVVNVAGGSLLRVTGDLFSLANGSTMRTLNGPIVNVSGNSVVDVSRALVEFSGAGNTINVANSLCPSSCATFSGIPVHFRNGASAQNLTIGPSPIRNPGAGTIVTSSSQAAVIVLDGAASRVTITAPGQ